MPVTQTQIAEETGLSQIAVSYALSGSSKVSEATRQRVRAVAATHGYRVNTAARTTRSGRFGAIALVMSTDYGHSTLPHQLLQGIQSVAIAHDLHLVLAQLPDDTPVRKGMLPKFLREHMCDGLIVNYTDHIPAPMLEHLRADSIPSVWINTRQSHDCVYPDDRQGARDVTGHLIAAGHAAIAYVDYSHGADDPEAHYSSPEREAGYRDAMATAGLPARVIRPAVALSGRERAAAAGEWLASTSRPTAVVCYSGHNAVPVAFAAAGLGLRIPDDLSLASVDDRPVEMIGRPFTSAIVPQLAMGRMAVRRLLAKLDQPRTPLDPVALPFALEPGETCTPPNAGGRGNATPGFRMSR